MTDLQPPSSQRPLSATYTDLKGKVVFISGGASGIGEEFVRAFASQGAHVAFADLDETRGLLLQNKICANDQTAKFIKVDVCNVQELQAAVRTVHTEMGPLKVLINNAARDSRHQISEVTPEYWNECLSINLSHHFFATQAAWPLMRETGGGSVICMSSNSWMLGLGGYPGYATAKAGVVGLTKVLARELGKDRVRVNAIVPGWVRTERQQRDGLWTAETTRDLMQLQAIEHEIVPEDIAQLALFLASDVSQAITGQIHIADGGRL